MSNFSFSCRNSKKRNVHSPVKIPFMSAAEQTWMRLPSFLKPVPTLALSVAMQEIRPLTKSQPSSRPRLWNVGTLTEHHAGKAVNSRSLWTIYLWHAIYAPHTMFKCGRWNLQDPQKSISRQFLGSSNLSDLADRKSGTVSAWPEQQGLGTILKNVSWLCNCSQWQNNRRVKFTYTQFSKMTSWQPNLS